MNIKRETVQEALDALKYHVERTRPIERTSFAIEGLTAALSAPTEPITVLEAVLRANPLAMPPYPREQIQRERMEARQAARAPSAATADFDLPAPNDALAAPEPQPLTADEIGAIADAQRHGTWTWTKLYAFARAIEAALKARKP